MLPGVKGNCSKLERWNGASWDAISKRVSMTGPGLSRETVVEERVLDCLPSGGNDFERKSPGTKMIGDISLEILWNPTDPTGTHQVETATAAGTVTVAGNAAVTITTALLAAPVVLAIPVGLGGATDTALAIRLYLANNAAAASIRDHFEISGGGASIVLTAKLPAADDSTLNIAIATGTATGITAAATSTTTVAGVAGEENDENHHLFEDDFEEEVATFWRIVHPNEAGTGCIVHATVREVGGETYEANANVKRTVVIEPTGEHYWSGNNVVDEVLPGSITAPQSYYGHH
jgi:hypothetical protein